MSFTIHFPPFSRDGRGNKLENFKISAYKGETDTALMLCGPEEVVAQVMAVANGACVTKTLTEKGKEKWTDALYFPDGVPQEIVDLCENLTDWLTIPSSESIDFSLSLDWYKQPGNNGDLVNTPAGKLISYTKYATDPTWPSSRRARIELLGALSDLIATHPLYAEAAVVTSPPGSKGDGQSFGEKLGRDVADKAGFPFAPMNGPARSPQKEEIARDVRGDFVLSAVVDGPVIIVDDVFHTGVTLESAALAARRAGASHVLTLTAARTLRK